MIARKSVDSKEAVERAYGILQGYHGECPTVVVHAVNRALEMSVGPRRLVELAEMEVTKQRLLIIYRVREIEMGGGVERGGMDGGRWRWGW